MVWATRDDAEAESLTARIVDRLQAPHSHKTVLARMALLVTCLEALGKLAERFPNLAVATVSIRLFALKRNPQRWCPPCATSSSRPLLSS